jgi:hypothetical protein
MEKVWLNVPLRKTGKVPDRHVDAIVTGSGLRDKTLALLLNFIILQREKNPPVLSDTFQVRLLYWFELILSKINVYIVQYSKNSNDWFTYH